MNRQPYQKSLNYLKSIQLVPQYKTISLKNFPLLMLDEYHTLLLFSKTSESSDLILQWLLMGNIF